MFPKRRYTYDNQPIFLLGEHGTEYHGQFDIQDFYFLRQQCIDSEILFEDPNFPATNQSISSTQKTNIEYEWLRPKEISKDPHFFVKGYSRFDVNQGELDDCWFLAAAANLTINQKLFTRVVCEDNSFDEKYVGIFHFCFWRFGKWVDVVVDDRLPTYNEKLVYNRSIDSNEFWSALLEKAYAKLHGSYETLIGGNTSEAFEDFTGGIVERIDLQKGPENLFGMLLSRFEKNSMMGCSTAKDDKTKGLRGNHAYSITKVKSVDVNFRNRTGNIELLRLRNPWGDDFEWTGAWSDRSPEWTSVSEETKSEIELTFGFDGEFWISYSDFLKHFDNLEICNLSPDYLQEKENVNTDMKWFMNAFHGSWIPGVSAGGCYDREKVHRNPQYVMHLEEPDGEDGKCSVVIALMQKNRRNKNKIGLEMLTIGFKVYEISENDLIERPFRNHFFKYNSWTAVSTFMNIREVSTRFRLSPGYYLIVPATYNPDEEGEFLIRVFSQHKNTFDEHDGNIIMEELNPLVTENIPEFIEPDAEKLEKLFSDVADENKELDWKTLQKMLEECLRDDFSEDTIQVNGDSKDNESTKQKNEEEPESGRFSKDTCRSMIAMLDYNHSGKLDLDEFKQLIHEIFKWKSVFKAYDKDQNNKLDSYELRDALGSAGYKLNNKILGSLLYRYGSSDNTMTLEDFIMCACKVKTAIDHFKAKDIDRINRAVFSIDEWVTNVLYS